jgi:hypothetical protein
VISDEYVGSESCVFSELMAAKAITRLLNTYEEVTINGRLAGTGSSSHGSSKLSVPDGSHAS